jgi:two-component system sensor histidine kinase PilS (NtrC family)
VSAAAGRASAPIDFQGARWASLRYFNLFRLTVASVFLVFGSALNLGYEAPNLYFAIALGYLAAVLALGFPDAARLLGLDRLTTLQVTIDIACLATMMAVSGGYRSGLPVLMMVVLAAAGLVGEGRMGLFYAAVATVLVLSENAWRSIVGHGSTEFFAVGMVCIGFFAVTLTARMLARRAVVNADLATERGRALAKQQAVNARIIRDMQDGVIVIDADGLILQSNPQASALVGFDLPERVALAELAPALAAGVVDSTARGEPAWVTTVRTLRCRAVGAREGGDTVIYLEDFDDIQRQTQQIKLAALGRLTASMAHEIRNPLAAVTHAAELLTEEKRGEMQQRLIRIVNDNARRIERLVRDVLALGKRDVSFPEALPLADCVDKVLDEFALRESLGREVFAVDVPADLHLAMDRTHLHQILTNLVSNALRYASGGSGAIRIRAEALAAEQVALHVEDDGRGVPEADRAQLFEPFFTTHSKGTGLGLYIARELAEANGARLELRENAPGAHFCLTGRRQP